MEIVARHFQPSRLSRDCVRRTDVYRAVADELGCEVNNALATSIAGAVKEMGGRPIKPTNRHLFARLRRVNGGPENARARRSTMLDLKARTAPKRLTARELSQLAADWDEKLKKSGFTDIEGPSGMVRGTPRINEAAKEINQAYLERCQKLLWEHEFEDDRDRAIWRLHCQGKSIRDIADAMNLYRDLVHRTIKKLRELMDRG